MAWPTGAARPRGDLLISPREISSFYGQWPKETSALHKPYVTGLSIVSCGQR
jgi:hypothetical protein